MSASESDVTTYQTELGWSVAVAGAWVPGLYDSDKTARAALALDDVQLQYLSDRICRHDGENRTITLLDLENV